MVGHMRLLSSGILLRVISSRFGVGLVLLAATLLTGCGEPPAASGPPMPSPSANPLLTAIERTKALGTAHITVTVTRADDAPFLSGAGDVDLAKGLGVMTWSDSTGTWIELDNERGTFVKTDGWKRQATRTSPLADPLAQLGMLQVRDMSSAPCGTSTCTRYRGTLPASDAALASLAYPAGSARPAQVEVTLDIDDRSRIITVKRIAGEVTLLVLLQDFSQPLDLSAPTKTA